MRFYGVEKSSVFVLLRPSVSVEAERDSVIQCVAESPCGAALAKVVQCVCVALSIGAVYVNVKAKEDSAVARSPVAINHRDKGGGGVSGPLGTASNTSFPGGRLSHWARDTTSSRPSATCRPRQCLGERE